MKTVQLVLVCAVLAVAARTQTQSTPPASEISSTFDALVYGDNNSVGLADYIGVLDRETDPTPLLQQRAMLVSMQAGANQAYEPAILALLSACDTALQLHTYLQSETPAIREAIPRYQRAMDALHGFPPANAVDAAILRNWESEALGAQRVYAQAAAIRSVALQSCRDAAALKVSADQTVNNP